VLIPRFTSGMSGRPFGCEGRCGGMSALKIANLAEGQNTETFGRQHHDGLTI
jgi:hypothetical protein